MDTRHFAEYDLSRLMLGTVQFGMRYGIANTQGQPDYAGARDMLAAAFEAGINTLDTAAGYGTSEEVLGRALTELKLADRMVVVTKVRGLTPDERADAQAGARAVRASVEQSLRRLRLESLPVVLFHQEADFACIDVLEDMRQQGHIRHAGVSCGNQPGPALRMLASGRAEAMQLPIRRQLAALAKQAGITLAELVLRALLNRPGVTCILTGVESVAQLRDNVAMINHGPLPTDLQHEVDDAVPELPEAVLTPRTWEDNKWV